MKRSRLPKILWSVLCLAGLGLGLSPSGVAKAATSLPESGTYDASFCTLVPGAQARCTPAVVQIGRDAMRVRLGRDRHDFAFSGRYVEVESRVAGRPVAHYMADFQWTGDDGRVLHFSETQPTQWEVRLGERRKP